MKVRSFLAFDIPDDMRAELASLIEVLASKADGIKWLKPENIHCTMKFFGDVEEEVLMGPLATVIEKELVHQAPFRGSSCSETAAAAPIFSTTAYRSVLSTSVAHSSAPSSWPRKLA